MAERGFGRVVNITSGAVKAPIDALALNGARSGLTGFVAGLARQPVASANDDQQPAARLVRHRPHPQHHAGAAAKSGQSVDAMIDKRRAGHSRAAHGPRRRVRRPAPSCSVRRRPTTGQNILLDGGGYPGTF